MMAGDQVSTAYLSLYILIFSSTSFITLSSLSSASFIFFTHIFIPISSISPILITNGSTGNRKPNNRRVMDGLIDFSGESSVQDYIKFFKAQQLAETRRFVNRIREKAQTVRNVIAQSNALIAEMEALEDQGEVFDTLMGLRDDRRVEETKLMGLNDLIT
nr:hypothetical protein [Tanacetum cinerariifolium]